MRVYFGYDPDIYTSRNQLLGKPIDYNNPKPFNGDDYDYILFIDSDMVFNYFHLERLMSHDKDIMSGLFMLTGGLYYSCAIDYDSKTGDSRKLSAYEGQMKKDIFKVDWNGLAFTLIKKGVFEKIGYPWFKQTIYKIDDGSVRIMACCLNTGEAAGIAAAMTAEQMDVRSIDTDALRSKLKANGAYLP
jgi:hypothetical protein